MKSSPPSSNRYWISPPLNLALRRSRIGLALSAGLWLALACAAALLYRDGYPLLAAGSLLYSAACLCVHRPPRPRALSWEYGRWQLALPGASWCEVELLPPARCLSVLVYLRWRCVGQSRSFPLYLWPDSADADALRQLRKRLALPD